LFLHRKTSAAISQLPIAHIRQTEWHSKFPLRGNG
jgi:hypothetical protein